MVSRQIDVWTDSDEVNSKHVLFEREVFETETIVLQQQTQNEIRPDNIVNQISPDKNLTKYLEHVMKSKWQAEKVTE